MIDSVVAVGFVWHDNIIFYYMLNSTDRMLGSAMDPVNAAST